MNKIWKISEANPRLQKVLSEALGVSPLLGQILVNRGIKTPEQAQDFLFGGLSSCHDPFLFKDMEKAVTRIRKAIDQKEKILIYGDYDVDGVTSTAILSYIFEELGANYETFIPNRLEEGYGMNIRAVAKAREDGVKLIVTVDCGINSVEEVKCANDYGIDVIITDHHEIKKGEELPKAYAIVDAHQEDCTYPYKHLAGVGIAYKLARALMGPNENIVDKHLDLVALGTVADVAPQSGENRILTRAGLKRLRNTDKIGISALMDVARVTPEKLTCTHIGFILGPRINAMGRVGSANVALELLMCKDRIKAKSLALTLDRENKNRQQIEKDILKDALKKVEETIDLEEEKAIVLADDDWHQGVLGIVASRLTDEYNVPTILISFKGDLGKGSGRSINGVNLFKAIKESEEHLVNFGGHEAACGVKVKKENVEAFRKAFSQAVKNMDSDIAVMQPELSIDLKVPFSMIGEKLIGELNLLMPHGPGNNAPVFATSDIKVKSMPREIGRTGFKFFATCGNLTWQAVTFRKKDVLKPKQGNVINLAYTPSINSWDGIDTIQLDIRDLQISEQKNT